jgi:3,4-dihydroxy 2-butanone 4-phosphate synthase / GTP cyclohydrolase II
MSRPCASIDEAARALACGRVIIVLDSEERENEGDFLAAAETVTPELIHFMQQRGCGQLCVPVAPDIATRVGLELMGRGLNSADTAFAVPIDHRSCKTGISPVERVRTIQAVLDPSSRPADFQRPGHVFPLIARDGGVLRRPGHTEAAVDLARIAGLAPVGVLCEICSRDRRDMAGRAEIFDIADEHDLLVTTIDELIRYRLLRRDESAAPNRFAAATII